MAVNDLIMVLALGGVLGLVGQAIRVITGMKKVYDQSVREEKNFSELFQGSQLAVSLLIGFVAGVLGVISFLDTDTTKFTKETLLTLIGIGYAGSDFIEGFIKKYVPTGSDSSRPTGGSRGTAGEDQPAVG